MTGEDPLHSETRFLMTMTVRYPLFASLPRDTVGKDSDPSATHYRRAAAAMTTTTVFC